ncbi:MAG: molybdopterin cofactor-binding domain-containing protein, partial [Pseudomonadota bacterium]
MFLNNPELGTTVEQLAGLSKTGSLSPRSQFAPLSRRHFVMASSGLALGVVLAGCSSGDENVADAGQTEEAVAPSPLAEVTGGDATPSLWIEIEDSGKVKITVHRSEMGQQVWTSMAQIVADELDADWNEVEIVQALGDPKYGDQNTDGSRSVRYNFHRLRVAGAAMRTMLERAAAAQWGIEPSGVRAELSAVIRVSDNESISFGDLAAAANGQPVPSEGEITLKDREDWRYIGKEVSSLTVEQIVRGEGTFGIDVKLPDMVYAVVARPPQIFGKTGNVDDTDTLAVPGVLQTVKLPDAAAPAMFQPVGGVAIVASDTWAAIQGREFLNVEWQDGPNAGHNSTEFDAALMETALRPGKERRNRGDVAAALEAADSTYSAQYHVPNFAHSAMEPPAATAKWEDGKLECWACVQDPQNTRGVLAGAFEMSPEEITVHATWLGGAFGRKSKPDFVVEAAMIAREVGRPVKVTWTREDDIRYDYYHAVSAQHMEAGFDAEGNVTALLHRTVFPTISSTFAAGANEPSSGEMGLGATDNPFDVPIRRCASAAPDSTRRFG